MQIYKMPLAQDSFDFENYLSISCIAEKKQYRKENGRTFLDVKLPFTTEVLLFIFHKAYLIASIFVINRFFFLVFAYFTVVIGFIYL